MNGINQIQMNKENCQDTLAPWTYLSDEFHQLEIELFKTNWLLAGHLSELRNPGDYITLDAAGERAIVIVGESGNIQGFHNVCRHRGARLLTESGNCKNSISCPFHGWTYGLDGKLRGVPLADTFEGLSKNDMGLVPLPVEQWQGFVFVSFSLQSTSVAELLKSVVAEVEPYKIDQMQPVNAGYDDLRPYNWKVIHDIDNEGYHVPVGHPSLHQLYGQNYSDRIEHGIPISEAILNQKPARLWSVRNYQNLLPEYPHLPAHRQKSWWYIGLFPNAVIALYPDMIEYYMTIPVSVNSTRYMGRQFCLEDNRREAIASRYLNSRINSITEDEDESFVDDMQQGMRSSVFPQPFLSSKEIGVQYFHQRIQSLLPVARLSTEPATGTIRTLNEQLINSTQL